MHWRSTVQTVQQSLQRRIVKAQDLEIPVNWKSNQNLHEVGNSSRESGEEKGKRLAKRSMIDT